MRVQYTVAIADQDMLLVCLELFLLTEEHREAYDGRVDQQASNDTHHHCLYSYNVAVCQYNGKRCETVSFCPPRSSRVSS